MHQELQCATLANRKRELSNKMRELYNHRESRIPYLPPSQTIKGRHPQQQPKKHNRSEPPVTADNYYAPAPWDT